MYLLPEKVSPVNLAMDPTLQNIIVEALLNNMESILSDVIKQN